LGLHEFALPERAAMTELADYYRDRAAEYDAIHSKPERQDDLAQLHELLPQIVAGQSILEIAAGTGYWTQILSMSARAITATDLIPETLDVARTRHYGPAPVTFQIANAYALDQAPGRFDMAFVGFFWSHILRADIPRFLHSLHSGLGSGTKVIVLDNRYVPGSNIPIARTTDEGDTYQRRTLKNGRCYEILKNFPTRDQFSADVAATVTNLQWRELPYYWLATCKLR
jgi:ubiquinone/menaquinone biosynthesis C-methylase UbiE